MYFHKLYVLIIIIFWFLKIVLKLPFMSRLFSSGCLKPLMFTLITFNLQNNSYFTLYFYFIPYPWYVLWMMRNRFVSLHPVIRIEPLTFTATLKPNVTWFLCVKYMFQNIDGDNFKESASHDYPHWWYDGIKFLCHLLQPSDLFSSFSIFMKW